jgi:hypothetical protein
METECARQLNRRLQTGTTEMPGRVRRNPASSLAARSWQAGVVAGRDCELATTPRSCLSTAPAKRPLQTNCSRSASADERQLLLKAVVGTCRRRSSAILWNQPSVRPRVGVTGRHQRVIGQRQLSPGANGDSRPNPDIDMSRCNTAKRTLTLLLEDAVSHSKRDHKTSGDWPVVRARGANRGSRVG